MKRSGPTRRTPVRPSTKPLKRSELPRARTRIRSKGGKRFPKGYDKAYRKWIRSLPCLLAKHPGHVCGGQLSVEPAHVHAEATGHGDRGQIVPLCCIAHRESPSSFHSMGRHSFPAYWGLGTFEDLERLAAEYGGRYTQQEGA